MRWMAIVLLIGSCGGNTYVTEVHVPPPANTDLDAGSIIDMSDQGFADMQSPADFSIEQDMVRPSPDLRNGTSADLDPPSTSDMSTASCGVIPDCNTSGTGPICCNGASCINGKCWNASGGYCCVDSSCNPVVVCFNGGQCGPGNKCV